MLAFLALATKAAETWPHCAFLFTPRLQKTGLAGLGAILRNKNILQWVLVKQLQMN